MYVDNIFHILTPDVDHTRIWSKYVANMLSEFNYITRVFSCLFISSVVID
jgi:hypothetical protein